MQKEQGGTPTNVTYNFTIFKSGKIKTKSG